ncbi:MAG: winged helix-turn-helix transcriptional regulator, partial [Rhodoferax sp.]|nr:winged helix-turn-helix transcriptional regulator [Rhodoferax sp.]
LLEITSAGAVHAGQEQGDFFAGYSMPRNKTLMRVFKDLEMVGYLGSGMPRILKVYPREAYTFSSHFIRITFPISPEALKLEREVIGELPERTTRRNYQKELPERTEDTILFILSQNPTITMAELAASLALTTDGIKYHLDNLRKGNRITRVGGRRFGQWQVLDRS